MPYSFIEPRPKKLFSPAVRRVWTATVLLLAATAAGAYWLHLDNARQRAALAELLEETESVRVQIGQLDRQLETMRERKEEVERIDTGNELLAERVKDLLDLVPDDTVLDRFELGERTLGFSGTTGDFRKLSRRFSEALKGEYLLQKSEHAPAAGGRERFVLVFTPKKEPS